MTFLLIKVVHVPIISTRPTFQGEENWVVSGKSLAEERDFLSG